MKQTFLKKQSLFFTLLFFVFSCLPVVTYAQSKSYEKLQNEFSAQKKLFVKNKDIVAAADETLEKLLKAKSPAVLSWMQRRNLVSQSEDEIVKQWRQYYVDEFFINQYPFRNESRAEKLNKIYEQFVNGLNKKFFTSKYRKQIDDVFSKTKKQSLLVIEQMNLLPEQKKQLIKIVSGISLYWFDDFKASRFADKASEFLNWGVAFDPTHNEINVGLDILSYPDLEFAHETLQAVFAHEMAHAFDSCRWSAFHEGVWPFSKVGDCLRGVGSVHALKRDDSMLDKMMQQHPEIAADVADLKKNNTCNSAKYPPVGVQADQLPESFADWFSAEVLASMISDIKVVRSDLQQDKELRKGSSYPKNQERLSRIYMAQPKIKKSLKLESDVVYCGL